MSESVTVLIDHDEERFELNRVAVARTLEKIAADIRAGGSYTGSYGKVRASALGQNTYAIKRPLED